MADPFKSGDMGGMLSSIRGIAGGSGAGATGGFETDIRPIGQPQGKRPKAKSPIATFMGADALPGPASSSFLGGKTLMGQ